MLLSSGLLKRKTIFSLDLNLSPLYKMLHYHNKLNNFIIKCCDVNDTILILDSSNAYNSLLFIKTKKPCLGHGGGYYNKKGLYIEPLLKIEFC